VSIERRTKVNPSKTRRKEASVVKTRSVKPFWDKPVRCLMTGQAATGVEGAWTRMQAFARNCRNQSL